MDPGVTRRDRGCAVGLASVKGKRGAVSASLLARKPLKNLVPQEGLEPPTHALRTGRKFNDSNGKA